jgi:hypothetical protein
MAVLLKFCMHSFSRVFCLLCPSYFPLSHNSNFISQRVQIMKLLIIQFFPPSYHFIPLQSKYSPQHWDGFLSSIQEIFSLGCLLGRNAAYNRQHKSLDNRANKFLAIWILYCLRLFLSAVVWSFQYEQLSSGYIHFLKWYVLVVATCLLCATGCFGVSPTFSDMLYIHLTPQFTNCDKT